MRRSAKASKKKWPVNRKEVMTGWGSGSWEKKVYPGRGKNACILSHFSSVWPFGTWWTVACQAPLSMGFFRQEFWSELPFPSPGNLPDPGIEPASPVSPALQVDSLLLSYQRSPEGTIHGVKYSWWLTQKKGWKQLLDLGTLGVVGDLDKGSFGKMFETKTWLEQTQGRMKGKKRGNDKYRQSF